MESRPHQRPRNDAADGPVLPWFRTRKQRIERRLRDKSTRPITLAVLAACVVLIGFLGYWIVLLTELPSTTDLEKSRFEQATVVYTSDGEELASYQDKNRKWVTLDEISPWVVKALIATEDHRFYEHSGIDIKRTIGSVFHTLSGDLQGGSTITMQFARNAYPDIYDDWMITRKVKEWITALRIEAMYDKDDILEMYLNTVPFMYNAFGIEAAAQTYFQAPASALNPKGAATLVGMLKGTVYYNPVRHPERSHERRNVVLELMVDRGYLDASEYETMRDVPTALNFERLTLADGAAPHFAEYLRQWLDDWAERYNANLYTDGLRVYTTIDSRLQEAGQEAVDRVGADLQDAADRTVDVSSLWNSESVVVESIIKRTRRFNSMINAGMSEEAAVDSLRNNEAFADSMKTQLRRVQAGFVAIDPQNGHVLAWVGGRDFSEVQYDHVGMAKRQPGSTFKPFVYAAALANGYSQTSLIRDETITYIDPDTDRRWRPTNVGEASGRMVTLSDALAYSKNTITAQIVQQIGPSRVVEYAEQMGIRSELDAVPSIGLGTSEVSLLELVGAYGTIANYGHYNEPIFVTRIEDHAGRVVARFSGESRSAIPSTIAYSVLDMMRGVVDYGTGVRIRNRYGVRGDVAAKTGTSQNGADGWFVLVHPNVVMGAWVGFTSPSIYFHADYYQQGAHTALPIVGTFYSLAREGDVDLLTTDARFTPPAGWVEPQPVDTSWSGGDYYLYASYLDSLRAAGDSLYTSIGDSAWGGFGDSPRGGFGDSLRDGFRDSLRARFDDEDTDLENLFDDEEDDELAADRQIEGQDVADSLNRLETRRPLGDQLPEEDRSDEGDDQSDQPE